MSVERVEFDEAPPRAVREAWAEWLRKHGVDPSDVLASGGWIERRPDAYQLRYASLVKGPDGRYLYDQERRTAVRETRVFQMEGPPLPFPDLSGSDS